MNYIFEKMNMRKIAVIVSLLLLTIVFGCGNQDFTGQVVLNPDIQVIVISEDGYFNQDECVQRGIKDSVFMLESKYCGHCKKTLPIFKEACDEKGINPIILDLSNDEQRKQMEESGISVLYTPTFIFGCDYYVGVGSKEKYLELLDNFLETNLRGV